MDQNTKDILETVNFIKERMLTKDDVRDRPDRSYLNGTQAVHAARQG